MSEDKVRREAAKQWFVANGMTVADWAAVHGFKRDQVYSVLNGRSAGRRGAGHQIAVALGLKFPATEGVGALAPKTVTKKDENLTPERGLGP